MSENPITPEPQPIDKPYLNHLDPWLKKYITKPVPGMGDDKHPDGTPLTEQEALEASWELLRRVARERRGTLAKRNEWRAENAMPPMTQEAFDEQIIKSFLSAALGQRELR